MGPNCPRSKLIYFVGIGYKGWINSRFTFVHKGISVITQDYIGITEQGL